LLLKNITFNILRCGISIWLTANELHKAIPLACTSVLDENDIFTFLTSSQVDRITNLAPFASKKYKTELTSSLIVFH